MTASNKEAATKIITLRHALLGAATLVVALIGASTAFAGDSPTVDCTIRFKPSGGSAIHEPAAVAP